MMISSMQTYPASGQVCQFHSQQYAFNYWMFSVRAIARHALSISLLTSSPASEVRHGE